MLDYKIVAIELFAILASYLILFLPVTGATNVRIFFGGQQISASLNPGDKVSAKVIASGGAVTVKVENNSIDQISDVLIYRCQGLGPAQCIAEKQPETFSGNMEKTYAWPEMADTVSSYPQKGYLIIMAMVAGSVNQWAGFHYEIYKNDPSTSLEVYSYELGTLDIYAAGTAMMAKIKAFIEANGMVPMNPAWIQRIVLYGMDGFHEILSRSPPADFTTGTKTGNQISGLNYNYSFVFPVKSGSYYSPLVLNVNPSYTCGANGCEAGLGESSSNCCHDCPCTATGQYCDIGMGCRSASLISLKVLEQGGLTISNCYQDHTVIVHAKIDNAPTNVNVILQSYQLGGGQWRAASCAESGGVYACELTVPSAGSACTGQDYVLTQNQLRFQINYPSGTSTETMTLTAAFPEITIGSWQCGDRVCNDGIHGQDLGEGPDNCCYDCICTGDSRYCDYKTGNLSTARCMTDLTNNNLQISSVRPRYFYTLLPGDSVKFDAKITDSPLGMGSVSPSCSVDCITGDSERCNSSCDVYCNAAASSGGNVYNSTCRMGLSITGYNETVKYYMYPSLYYAVAYNNGSAGQIAKTISRVRFAEITVDKHWCGDGKCDPDENSGSCCFDCACTEGRYCNSQSILQPSPVDECKPLSDIALTTDSFTPLMFDDSMFTHDVSVIAKLASAPAGAALMPSCQLAGGETGCHVSCTEIDTDLESLCTITIPSIDYRTSPLYDSASRTITLRENQLNITLEFNNGSGKAGINFRFAIPDITIAPTFHCGNDDCEADMGESLDNCCIDCACTGEDQYCYTGGFLAGECLNASDLYLVFGRTAPEGFGCSIMELNGKCIFTKALRIETHVLNPPDDMTLVSAWYEKDRKTRNANCYRLPESSNFSCSVILENLNDSTEGATNISGVLSMTVRFTANGTKITKNLTTVFFASSLREKTEYVKTCEAEIARLDDKIESLEEKEEIITIILYAWIIVAVALAIACVFDCGWCCDMVDLFICIGVCLAAVLLPVLNDIKSNVEMLKAQRSVICATNSFSGLSGANMDSLDIGNTIIAAVLSVVCIICALSKFNLGVGEGLEGIAGGTTALPAVAPAAATTMFA